MTPSASGDSVHVVAAEAPLTADQQHAPPERPAAAPARALGPIATISLAVLAVLAVIFVLRWARAVCIPVMLGVLLSHALSPAVNLLQSWRIPRAIGAAVLLLGIVSGVAAMTYSLGDEAGAFMETLPEAAENFRLTLRPERVKDVVPVDSMQEAAEAIEEVVRDTASPPPRPARGVTRVQIEQPKLNIQDYLWAGTVGFIGAAGQALVVLFLVYLLLVAGGTFRRKLVGITGPALSRKKLTVHVLDDITSQLQRYLLIQIAMSALVGGVTWLAFLAIGLEYAAIWGLAAGLLNIIPYLGPIVITGGSTVVAMLQFGSLDMALLVGGVSLLITGLEGYLLTPWLTGRAGRINPVVVFVSVVFWGWLWGAWGLLLGVPIVMILKSVCDHVEDLKPVSELLAD